MQETPACPHSLNISGITLINSNGWFIVEITVFYLLFYLIFRLVRNRDAALVLLCMAVAGIMIFSFFQGHDPVVAKVHWFRGEWWYNSTISFIFGLVFARFRARAEALFRNRYAVLMGISSLLFTKPEVSQYLMSEMRLQQAMADIFRIITEAADIDLGLPGLS